MVSFFRRLLVLLSWAVVRTQSFSVVSSRSDKVHRQLPSSTTTALGSTGALEVDATCEVVGGHGRIGSLFLREEGAIAVPRGVAPGCLTRSSKDDGVRRPIIVAVPSIEWKHIFDRTPLHRRRDLVWVGNGLLSESWQRNSTVVVPHFGVLTVGGDPVTSSESPATFVFGEHAAAVKEVLMRRGVESVSDVKSWTDICYLAARKLLWSCCMWLLCHSPVTAASTDIVPPLTFKQVHEFRQEELDRLVKELMPAFALTLFTQQSAVSTTTAFGTELDMLAYMKAYSLSMPQAIPSKDLAIVELQDRNGIWFTADQPFHRQLLERVAGRNKVVELQRRAADRGGTPAHTVTSENTKLIPIPEIGIVCSGETTDSISNDDRTVKSVIVIGGGIIGSSIARALSQNAGIKKITVYDPTPTGTTTPASWAWLNANAKPPHAYRSLNQLGLRGWRVDSILNPLPRWTGTLVRTKEKLELTGGYSVEGPLSKERVRELEPQANFTDTDDTVEQMYYFADEGHVDPHEAVRALRREATGNGVEFINDRRVIDLVRNEQDRVVGVRTSSSPRDGAQRPMEKLADVVIVAAGANSSDMALGGVPLVHNPSRTYFATPSSSTAAAPQPALLDRTLVDMVQQLYIAQRNDGTFIAGGGALKFGLSATSVDHSPQEVRKQMTEAQRLATLLAPNPIGNCIFTHKEEAIKPMPKDGFPILGFLEAGLYSAVTHSGMTMAPLIGQLVATEVKERVSLRILDDYRPTRFNV